jgi:predicted 3-demethylubiquinone-9 3-methyltransferase (glyoxalase superfamily)
MFVTNKTYGMQKIVPFLWFNNNAEEAIEFYTSVFKEASSGNVVRYDKAGSQVSGRPEGSVMTIAFQLFGQEFIALNGGPHFTFNEAISFVVNCENQAEVDYYWEKACADG